jgi:hypothetical protein
MALQGPKAVVFEGKGGGATAQIAAVPRKKGAVLECAAAAANTPLPLSTNGQPFQCYRLSNIGAATVYWALGVSDAATVEHVLDEFDDVVLPGLEKIIVNDAALPATYIAGITVADTATLVIVGLV